MALQLPVSDPACTTPNPFPSTLILNPRSAASFKPRGATPTTPMLRCAKVMLTTCQEVSTRKRSNDGKTGPDSIV